MKTLKEDLNSSLENIERHYIRIPLTLFLSPLVLSISLIAYIVFAFIDFYKEFFIECLLGKK